MNLRSKKSIRLYARSVCALSLGTAISLCLGVTEYSTNAKPMNPSGSRNTTNPLRSPVADARPFGESPNGTPNSSLRLSTEGGNTGGRIGAPSTTGNLGSPSTRGGGRGSYQPPGLGAVGSELPSRGGTRSTYQPSGITGGGSRSSSSRTGASGGSGYQSSGIGGGTSGSSSTGASSSGSSASGGGQSSSTQRNQGAIPKRPDESTGTGSSPLSASEKALEKGKRNNRDMQQALWDSWYDYNKSKSETSNQDKSR